MIDVEFIKEGKLYRLVFAHNFHHTPVHLCLLPPSIQVPGVAEKRPSVLIGEYWEEVLCYGSET